MLNSGDLMTKSILLDLRTVTSDLTKDDYYATNSITMTYNTSDDVVGSETDWCTSQKFELEDFKIGSSI
jgi:hypothetical protein